MEKARKKFQFLRALDVTTFFLLALFAAFIIKTIAVVINAFQSEVYTNVVAGLSSM